MAFCIIYSLICYHWRHCGIPFASGQPEAWAGLSVMPDLIRDRQGIQFNKYFGAVLGISYFDADITINEEIKSTDVTYGYEGFFLGLHVIF